MDTDSDFRHTGRLCPSDGWAAGLYPNYVDTAARVVDYGSLALASAMGAYRHIKTKRESESSFQNMGDFEPVDFLRQVDKAPPYYYLKASLEYEGRGQEKDALQFKHVMMQAVTQIFGQVGASDTVDLLKLSSNGVAFLRIPSRCYVKLWAALTLFGKHKGQPCAFRVHQVSANLISLSSSSRNWETQVT